MYELPAGSPKTSSVVGGPRAAVAGSTPHRADKHVSSPPSQHNRTNGQSPAKPTLRAGAFQAARSRSNSTPRASEWYTSASPKSHVPIAPQTKSEIVQRPSARPQSMIVPPNLEVQDNLRVSALPISRSRRSNASLEGLDRSVSNSPTQVVHPPRPAVPQRSVSAHPGVASHLVRDEETCVIPMEATSFKQSAFMQVPMSAKSEPLTAVSMDMERAKSASAVPDAAGPAKSTRPRSLTLTAKNPAELDSIFQEFIVSQLRTAPAIEMAEFLLGRNPSIYPKLFPGR